MMSCQNSIDDVAPIENREWLPGDDTTNELLLGANAFMRPVSNISDDKLMLFHSGNSFFNQPWVAAPASTKKRDGLGPLFNANSCAACHFKDGRGRPPLNVEEPFLSLLLKLNAHISPKQDFVLGDQLQPHSIAKVPIEGTPSVIYETIDGIYPDGQKYSLIKPTYAIRSGIGSLEKISFSISPRVAPAVFGAGLLEAIPEKTLLSLNDPDDTDGDGISGKLNYVLDRTSGRQVMGRFGWKAEQPTVLQQSAAAFNGDMGITSSLFPKDSCTINQVACNDSIDGGSPEIDDETLKRVSLYVSLLAVPVRKNYASQTIRKGKYLFNDIGCASCHTPRHVTSESQSVLAELRGKTIWPYTDMLLHDMGDGLADQNHKGEILAKEWRTPPLWGIGYYEKVNKHTRLLHDGRARNIEEAILWHGGEGEKSREKFMALSDRERNDLMEFVRSL